MIDVSEIEDPKARADALFKLKVNEAIAKLGRKYDMEVEKTSCHLTRSEDHVLIEMAEKGEGPKGFKSGATVYKTRVFFHGAGI